MPSLAENMIALKSALMFGVDDASYHHRLKHDQSTLAYGEYKGGENFNYDPDLDLFHQKWFCVYQFDFNLPILDNRELLAPHSRQIRVDATPSNPTPNDQGAFNPTHFRYTIINDGFTLREPFLTAVDPRKTYDFDDLAFRKENNYNYRTVITSINKKHEWMYSGDEINKTGNVISVDDDREGIYELSEGMFTIPDTNNADYKMLFLADSKLGSFTRDDLYRSFEYPGAGIASNRYRFMLLIQPSIHPSAADLLTRDVRSDFVRDFRYNIPAPYSFGDGPPIYLSYE